MNRDLSILFGILLLVIGAICLPGCGTDDGQGPVKVVGPAGPQGANGVSSNITLTPVTTDSTVCASGKGVLIQTFTPNPCDGWCTEGTTLSSAAYICDGTDGGPGAEGPRGQTGATGAAGTQVGIVQFCPGGGTNYPVTFPEVGFCINGNIYAVYSANDGFLTEVTPGAYSSNAVGSACNFTLLANCQVQ